jgi:ATP-dependent DNA helicase 2 subunit 1
MTVAELATRFKPAPRQLGPGAQKLQEQQQKAKEKTPKKPRGERKKRDSVKAQDENGNPRKRKKKNNGVAQAGDSANEPMTIPDYPGASGIDGQNLAGPSYTNGGQASNGQQGFSDYPQGPMGEGASTTANGTASQQTGQPGSASFPVNVSAAEAARRREAATTMLSNAGVDPTTLSADQFGIFANQAPELQRESLNMLVKYGAERLRIVHPGNREDSAQASASSQSSQTTSSSSGPMTTKELVPQSSAQSNANGDTAASQVTDDSTSKRKTKKMGKSRTACFPCKARKTKVSIQNTTHLYKANIEKCPKETPTCTECSNHGTSCEYAHQNPRNRGKAAKKSAAIVVDDDEGDEEEDGPEDEPQEDAEGEEPDQEEEAEEEDEQTTSQDYSYPQMNIGNMVTNNVSQTDPYSTSSQPLTTAMSQRDNYSHTLPEAQPIRHPPPPIPAPAGTIAPSETRRWTAFGGGASASASGSSSKTRRSLPSEPPTSGQSVSTTNPQPSDWAQSTNTTMPTTTMASVSPQMSYSTRSGQRSRQKNQSLTNDTAQQASTVANSAMQQAQAQAHAHTRQSPVAAAAMIAQARKSPYQQVAVPRTTSRSSQRNQSRTPVAEQTRGYQPPPPDLSQQQSTRPSAHYDTSQMASGSGYSNSHGRYSGSNTATNHQPAMSAASATPTTMSTSYQTTQSTANQWSGSSSRNDRSYDSNSSYQTPNVYNQAASSKPASASASRQNFNMRNNTQHNTRGSSGSYNQQPQQNFSSYSGSSHQNQQGQTPSQQQQQAQQAQQAQQRQQQQQPGWYFQNPHNPSLYQGAQSSGYNYEPWSGV